MPNTITSIYSAVAGTTALASIVNNNFNNMRGDRIPLDMSAQSAAHASYDLGRSDKRWRNLYLKGDIYLGNSNLSGLNIGTILPMARTTPPLNYLLCDGSSISRTTYSDLFSIITNGSNTLPCFGFETSTNFNLPDLRGKFSRGVDSGAGNDPDSSSRATQGTNGSTGDSIGSIQATASAPPSTASTDTGGSHSHNVVRSQASGPYTHVYHATFDRAANYASWNSDNWNHNHTFSGGDSETRPINLYLNYFIRY